MSRKSFSYTHGDVGTEPSSSLDFQKNERPEAQDFDWYWYNVIEAIKGHAQEFDRLDSDDDGIVDEADYAANADKVDGSEASEFLMTSGGTMSGNLTLSDGSEAASKSWVQDQPSSVDVRTSAPSDPENGQTWILE